MRRVSVDAPENQAAKTTPTMAAGIAVISAVCRETRPTCTGVARVSPMFLGYVAIEISDTRGQLEPSARFGRLIEDHPHYTTRPARPTPIARWWRSDRIAHVPRPP